MNNKHNFHLVKASYLPLLGGFSAFMLCNGGVLYMHQTQYGSIILLFGFFLLIFTMILWWQSVIDESFKDGFHTLVVQRGLKYGMILFIVSEIMFFFAFFWGYFHSSLAPSIELGSVWPPAEIVPFSPWGIPLLNTLILLLSAVTVTWAHHAIILNLPFHVILGLSLTLGLAVLFTMLQVYEYSEASFNISDSVYGSCFYMATGFHGFHVFLGTIFLTVAFVRYLGGQFSCYRHFGFEAAIWYWHFVDVVWLYLYAFIYVWSYSDIESQEFNPFSSFLDKFKIIEMEALPYQMGFSDSITVIKDAIHQVYDYVNMFLVMIVIGLFIYAWRVLERTCLVFLNKKTKKEEAFSLLKDLSKVKSSHDDIIEFIWTIIPILILTALGIPSFLLLYSMDEITDPALTFKVVGHQWYWEYNYNDTNFTKKEFKIYEDFSNDRSLEINSLMIPEEDLILGELRNNETTNPPILPIETHIRIMVTAADVLHSWTVPSMGIKIDAIPGRLNHGKLFIYNTGESFGQCSEICGVHHGFMPIKVISVLPSKFVLPMEQDNISLVIDDKELSEEFKKEFQKEEIKIEEVKRTDLDEVRDLLRGGPALKDEDDFTEEEINAMVLKSMLQMFDDK